MDSSATRDQLPGLDVLAGRPLANIATEVCASDVGTEIQTTHQVKHRGMMMELGHHQGMLDVSCPLSIDRELWAVSSTAECDGGHSNGSTVSGTGEVLMACPSTNSPHKVVFSAKVTEVLS